MPPDLTDKELLKRFPSITNTDDPVKRVADLSPSEGLDKPGQLRPWKVYF